MAFLETLATSISTFLVASTAVALQWFLPVTDVPVTPPVNTYATTTEFIVVKPPLENERLVQTGLEVRMTPALDTNRTLLGAPDINVDERFVGLLSHVRWLMAQQNPENFHLTRVDRLEKQIFRFMDDEADNSDSVTTIVTEGGLSTTSNLTLTAPVFNGAIASNFELGSNWISGDGDDEGIAINASGFIGIGTNTPSRLLTVAGDMFVTGALRDGGDAVGVNGMVLLATGTSTRWVATSTLGLGGSGGGLFVSDIDTSSKLATILGDETGTGLAVFNAGPTFTGTTTMSALTLSSLLSLGGSAANIALGSNYLSGDGDDEGIRVSNNGYVSIGTALELAPLSLVTGNATTAMMIGNNTSDSRIVFSNNIFTNFASLGLLNGGLALSGSPDISTATHIYINDSGNVGIGTTSPLVKLDVVASGTAASIMARRVDGSGIRLGVTTSEAAVLFDGTLPLNFRAPTRANLESNTVLTGPIRMTMATSGNIGIGTTSPSTLFAVAGTMTVTATSSLSTTTVTDIIIARALRDAANSAGTNGMVLQSTGTSTLWVATSSLGFTNGSTFTNSSELAALLSDETGTGLAVFNSSPTFTGTAIFANLTGANATITSATTTNLAISTLTSGRVPFITTGGRLTDSTNLTFDGSRLSTLNLNVTGTSTFAATSTFSGRVSIGTTSSNAVVTVVGPVLGQAFLSARSFDGTPQLQINNIGYISIGTTSDLAYITLQRNNPGAFPGIAYINVTNPSTRWETETDFDDRFQISYVTSASSAVPFSISNAGNVGIGSTSPSSRLTVGGNTYIGGSLTATGTFSILGTSTLATTTITDLTITSATTTNLAISSLTSGRVPYITTGGRLIDSANLTFNGTSLTLGTDVSLSRGAANRLDLATGDNFNIVSGAVQFGGTTYFTADTTTDNIKIGELAGTNMGTNANNNIAIGYQSGRAASPAGANFNTYIGYTAGEFNSGTGNNILGVNTGRYNSGDYNEIFGLGAGADNTGNDNIFIGSGAALDTSATNTVALGVGALGGTDNTISFSPSAYIENTIAIGYQAGSGIQTGANNNIFIGYQAADNLISGAHNIVLGYDIDLASTTGSHQLNIGNLIFGTGINGTGTVLSTGNIGIGTSSPNSKLTVGGNTYIGGSLSATGTFSILGTSTLATTTITDLTITSATTTNLAISSLTSGRVPYITTGGRLIDSANLTFNGTSLTLGTDVSLSRGAANRLDLATGDNFNIVSGAVQFGGVSYLGASSTNDSITFGELAGATFTTNTANNIAIGYWAGRYASTSTAVGNIYLGYQAGLSNTGDNNIIVGNDVAVDNSGTANVIIGLNAGYANTGDFNLMLGGGAGASNSGDRNSFFGGNAGEFNRGSYSTLLGKNSGYANSGSYVSVLGYQAGYNNTGSYSEFIGTEAAAAMSASSSVAIGSYALRGGSGLSNAATTSNNVVIGYRAGYSVQTGGNNNILLGYQAADNLTSGAHNIVLGYDIDLASTTGSHQLNIGNLIFGTGINGTGTVLSTGNIGIGTSSPTSKLTVVGGGVSANRPSAPQLVGSFNSGGFAYAVAVVGRYAYLADYNVGLRIVDVSQPSSPSIRSTFNTAGNAVAVQVVGRYAYVADESAGLQIIDVSNPTTPLLVSTIDTSGAASGVFLSGRYAYVADGTSGLQIVDISNPASSTIVGTFNTSGTAQSVTVTGRYAYVADGTSGLQIIDVSNPTSPSLVSAIDTVGLALDVKANGRYAYVADDTAGLQIIDISNPASSTLMGTYNTPGAARGLTLAGQYAYVADGTAGLQIIDVSNPASPSLVSTIDTPESANGVTISGRYAYVADDMFSGFDIIDINGSEFSTLYAGAIGTTDVSAENNLLVGNTANVGGGLTVGHDARIGGSLTIAGTASTSLLGTNINPALIVTTGNVGIGTTSPSSKLTVAGTFLTTGTTTLATTTVTDLTITAALRDTTGSAGTLGMVLQSTGTSTRWVATSSLGIAGGGAATFIGLTDTPASFTADRILFTNASGTALVDNNNFRYSSSSQLLTLAGNLATGYGVSFSGVGQIFGSNILGNNDLVIGALNNLNRIILTDLDDSSFDMTMGDGVITINAATSTNINSQLNVLGNLALTGAFEGTATTTFMGGVAIGTTTPVSGARLTLSATGSEQTLRSVARNVLDNDTRTGMTFSLVAAPGDTTTGTSYVRGVTNEINMTDLSVVGSGVLEVYGSYTTIQDAGTIDVTNERTLYGASTILTASSTGVSTAIGNQVVTYDAAEAVGFLSASYGPLTQTTNAIGFRASGSSMNNYYGFYVQDDGGANLNSYAFYAAGNMRSYFGGNVGIGSTSPSRKLTVSGDAFIDGNIITTGAISTTGSANFGSFTSTNASLTSATTTNLAVSTLTSGRVPFITTGGQLTDSTHLTFDGTRLGATNLNVAGTSTITGTSTFAGRVGIGTTSPVGSARLTIAATNSLETLYLDSAGITNSGDRMNAQVITRAAVGDVLNTIAGTTNFVSLIDLTNLTLQAGADFTATGASIEIIDAGTISSSSSRVLIGQEIVINASTTGASTIGGQAIQVYGRTAIGQTIVAGGSEVAIGVDSAVNSEFTPNTAGISFNAFGFNNENYYGFLASDNGTNNNAFAFYASGTMRSYFGGNVGIGTTTPVEKLTVDGTIRSTNLEGGATNLTTDANGNIIRDPSDSRLKTNVTEIAGALEQVLALRGVRYNWIDTERFGEQTEVGFIAQEVDLVVPEVVSKGGEYWSLNSKNLIAVVVEAIQEMWVTVTGHEERLDSLEAENALLRSRIENLEGAAPASGGGGGNPSVPDNAPTDQTPEPSVEENQTPTEETPPEPESPNEDPVSAPLPEEVVSIPNEGDAEVVPSE